MFGGAATGLGMWRWSRVVLVHGAMLGFWSKLQSNVPLSSAEAELTASL